MTDSVQFRRIAIRGLIDLGASLALLPRDERSRALSRAAWGPPPLLVLGLAAAIAGVAGLAIGDRVPAMWMVRPGVWPVLILAAAAAWRIRSVVRRRRGEVSEDVGRSFRALALPLVPAAAVLAAVTTVGPYLAPAGWPGARDASFATQRDGLSIALTLLEQWLALGAVLAVSVATFVARRRWFVAAFEFAWRYITFEVMLIVSHLVLGVASSVLWGLVGQALRSLVGWRLPDAWRAVLDSVLGRGFESLVFLGLIGAAWASGFAPSAAAPATGASTRSPWRRWTLAGTWRSRRARSPCPRTVMPPPSTTARSTTRRPSTDGLGGGEPGPRGGGAPVGRRPVRSSATQRPGWAGSE